MCGVGGAWVHCMHGARSTIWQLLPLNKVSPGQDTPTAASSYYALEPVYVDLRAIPDLENLASDEEVELGRLRRQAPVDFEGYRRGKRAALRRAFGRFPERERGTDRGGAFREFRRGARAGIQGWGPFRAVHDQPREST